MWLSWLSLVLLCATAVAQGTGTGATTELHVRVVNVRTGKPVRNTTVYLYRDQAYPRAVTPKAPPTLAAKTGLDGVATFQLPLPLPPKLFFAVLGGDRLCSDYHYESSQLVDSGVVGETKPCAPKSQVDNRFSAHGGELILFVKPYTRWEYFKREIL